MSAMLRDMQLAVCIVSTLKYPVSNPCKIASTMLFFSLTALTLTLTVTLQCSVGLVLCVSVVKLCAYVHC